jgi:hypothetical protein
MHLIEGVKEEFHAVARHESSTVHASPVTPVQSRRELTSIERRMTSAYAQGGLEPALAARVAAIVSEKR